MKRTGELATCFKFVDAMMRAIVVCDDADNGSICRVPVFSVSVGHLQPQCGQLTSVALPGNPLS